MNELRSFRLLQRLVNLRGVSNQIKPRRINTSTVVRGGGHGHGAEAAPKKTGLLSFIMEAENPHLHRGYLYREKGNLQGATNATAAKALLTFAWWWIFYWLYHTPETFLGHAPYPDTSKWTDEELGIPADDEE